MFDISRWNKYLSGKSSPFISIFVLLVAIAAINAWQLVLPNFSSDNSFSLTAAKNIYDGKGYTLTSISHEDLSVTHYEPLNKWPPGYSLLLALVKKLTGTDWIISCYILNALGASFLILALRKIMLLLNIPSRLVNVYLLFTGAVPYPFLSCWFSDLQAAACFMWALAILLQMIVRNKYRYSSSIAAGLLLGWCAWVKYLYLPVSLIPFFILVIYACRSEKRVLLKPLVGGGVLLLVTLIGLLWFQREHSGAAFYINPTGRGFFPESLLDFAPIVPGSMLDFNFINYQLSNLFPIPYQKMIFFWRGLNILFMSGILFLIVQYYKEYRVYSTRPIHVYLNLALAISLTISLSLVYLSLTQAPFTNQYTKYWTYVEELRYFAIVLLFIPQIIIFLIFYRTDMPGRLRKTVLAWAACLAIVAITHAVYYLPKKIFLKNEVGKNRATEELDLLALKTAGDLIMSDDKVVVCSDSHEMANIASLAGVPVMYNDGRLNGRLVASKKISLLVILSKQDLPLYEPFFSAHHPRHLFTYKSPVPYLSDTEFYIAQFPE